MTLLVRNRRTSSVNNGRRLDDASLWKEPNLTWTYASLTLVRWRRKRWWGVDIAKSRKGVKNLTNIRFNYHPWSPVKILICLGRQLLDVVSVRGHKMAGFENFSSYKCQQNCFHSGRLGMECFVVKRKNRFPHFQRSNSSSRGPLGFEEGFNPNDSKNQLGTPVL